MSSKPNSEDRQELQEVQAHAMQGVLFTLEELGETSAFLQLELEGVQHFLAARKLTQTEFDELIRQAVCKS